MKPKMPPNYKAELLVEFYSCKCNNALMKHMDTKINQKAREFAVASLVLGTISAVLVALPFLIVSGVVFGERDAFTDYMFSARGHLIWSRSLIFSLPGCIAAILAIRRNGGKDDASPQTKVVVGLLLNGFILLTALVLYTVTPTVSYPNMPTTPSNLLP